MSYTYFLHLHIIPSHNAIYRPKYINKKLRIVAYKKIKESEKKEDIHITLFFSKTRKIYYYFQV